MHACRSRGKGRRGYRSEAWLRIIRQLWASGRKLRLSGDDERVLFQKRRYQPEGEQKTFRIYRPGEHGNWIASIDPPDGAPTKRVLYNQARVVTANVVAVCEGEKDADTRDDHMDALIEQLGRFGAEL